jgi:hypothetical protein
VKQGQVWQFERDRPSKENDPRTPYRVVVSADYRLPLEPDGSSPPRSTRSSPRSVPRWTSEPALGCVCAALGKDCPRLRIHTPPREVGGAHRRKPTIDLRPVSRSAFTALTLRSRDRAAGFRSRVLSALPSPPVDPKLSGRGKRLSCHEPSARSDRIATHIGLPDQALRVLAGVVTAGGGVRAGERGCGRPVTVMTSSVVRARCLLWHALATWCDQRNPTCSWPRAVQTTMDIPRLSPQETFGTVRTREHGCIVRL